MTDDASSGSPPRVHPAPSPRSSHTVAAAAAASVELLQSPPSKPICLPPLEDDGWQYAAPVNLPRSAAEAMALATEGRLHSVDMTDTYRMMTRGQRFTSYSTRIEHRTQQTAIVKKEIFIFYNKYEIDRDGAARPCSGGVGSGSLYWTSGSCPSHTLTFHRSIPLRDIRELLLGKESQCFLSPTAADAVDELCFTIRCDSRQLDLECSSAQQISSWMLGLVNMMLSGQNRRILCSDDTPTDCSRDAAEQRQQQQIAAARADDRRSTRRFSVQQLQAGDLSADYRRLSSSWRAAVKAESLTSQPTRGTLARAAMQAAAPGAAAAVSRERAEAKLLLPFQHLRSSFRCLQAELTAAVGELSSSLSASLSAVSAAASASESRCRQAVCGLQSELQQEHRVRKALQNRVIDLQGNIRVFCRVRPVSEDEAQQGDDSVIDCTGESALRVTAPAAAGGGSRDFEFDRVFPPGSSQELLYRDVAPFVQSVVDGYNVCVFAYGQTGSGKSFTMEGSQHDRGLNYRALQQLFATTRIEQQRAEQQQQQAAAAASSSPPPNRFLYSICISVLEIYNESVCDLLVRRRDARPLDIKQAQDGGVCVPELTETEVFSVEEVRRLLQDVAYPNRHTAATSMNEHSSRSHCLLFVRVLGVNPHSDERTAGKLVLIDLAGSERLSRSQVSGVGVKEAQCINASLSALGNCVNALQLKAPHIPYRNSKLTYLLSDCLGGSSKCIMFCQLSPCASSYGESLCSLGFASRARSVELGMARRNTGGEEVRRLKAQARDDKKERERLKEEVGRASRAAKDREAELREREDSLARLSRELREREKELQSLREREAERERETERLREGSRRKDRKRVEWSDTRRRQENGPSASAASAAASASPSASASPLRDSTLVNRKRKDSPARDEDGQPHKRAQGSSGEPAPASPRPAASQPAQAAAVPQSHSRIGAALREKYHRRPAAGLSQQQPQLLCLTPLSLCGAAPAAVRFTSSSVAEAAPAPAAAAVLRRLAAGSAAAGGSGLSSASAGGADGLRSGRLRAAAVSGSRPAAAPSTPFASLSKRNELSREWRA